MDNCHACVTSKDAPAFQSISQREALNKTRSTAASANSALIFIIQSMARLLRAEQVVSVMSDIETEVESDMENGESIYNEPDSSDSESESDGIDFSEDD